MKDVYYDHKMTVSLSGEQRALITAIGKSRRVSRSCVIRGLIECASEEWKSGEDVVPLSSEEVHQFMVDFGASELAQTILYGRRAFQRTPFPWPIARQLTEVVMEMLKAIDPREAMILKLRFGIGRSCLSLAEVGDIYGLSRGRIRQIQIGAMRKLRHPRRQRSLREFDEWLQRVDQRDKEVKRM